MKTGDLTNAQFPMLNSHPKWTLPNRFGFN